MCNKGQDLPLLFSCVILIHMAIDWTKIYQKYKGLWVALDEDEKMVVAYDKVAKRAYDKAKKKGIKIPILFKVPTKIIPYVGGFVEI